MIVGIDHGYYAIKTRQVSFPSGIIRYDYEPYTMQNVLQYQGKYYVCGTGRQTLVKNKTTVDLMRLDNAVPNAATCRSLELGVIRCIDETAEQVRRNTGLSVTETQIERVLRGETCSMAEDARVVIQENGRKYIERILSAVTESGFDLRAVPSVFMGGGSAILKRHVTAQDAICRPVFIEDVHANAAGYERIVEQMWAK